MPVLLHSICLMVHRQSYFYGFFFTPYLAGKEPYDLK